MIGDITEFTEGLSAGAHPVGITAGPDGNVWFTVVGAIGRITPDGEITEFSEGIHPKRQPTGIVAGPDGNLWFTESRGAIGRITLDGKVTEFEEGIGRGNNLLGIDAGPDGNLWFAAQCYGGWIGRITLDGEVTRFSEGIRHDALPGAITAGPDGNLWFTNLGRMHSASMDLDNFPIESGIGRITTDGEITEFTDGLSPMRKPPDIVPEGVVTGCGPSDIVSGRDGNVWFAEFHGDRIASVAPDGTITEYAEGITIDSRPDWLTIGADGNVWFTEPVGNRIGRLELR